jgi:hypothetical protein
VFAGQIGKRHDITLLAERTPRNSTLGDSAQCKSGKVILMQKV